MDKFSHLRDMINQEKLQIPNTIRPHINRTAELEWRDIVTCPDGGDTIPGSSVVEIEPIVTTPNQYWWWTGVKPTGWDMPYGEVGITMPAQNIASGQAGKLVTIWPALVNVDGFPSVGDFLGTKPGEFNLQVGRTGFTVVAVVGPDIWVVPTGGSGGGDRGYQGWQGPGNLPGATGAQGVQGAQGNQGFQGWQGPQGWQGWQGLGSDGNQGRQGFQGPQGWQGFGSQGAQGTAGSQGGAVYQ